MKIDAELLDDDTLILTVPKDYFEYINRVIIEDCKVFRKPFYPTEGENYNPKFYILLSDLTF